MTKGTKIAVHPKANKRLNKFDPKTFPNVMSLLPFSEADILTASSGALVPNDTIVSPIITVGTPSFLAIFEAPSTKRSAPLISKRNPIIRNM